MGSIKRSELFVAHLKLLLDDVDSRFGPRLCQFDEIERVLGHLGTVDHDQIEWTTHQLDRCSAKLDKMTPGIAIEGLRHKITEAKEGLLNRLKLGTSDPLYMASALAERARETDQPDGNG